MPGRRRGTRQSWVGRGTTKDDNGGELRSGDDSGEVDSLKSGDRPWRPGARPSCLRRPQLTSRADSRRQQGAAPVPLPSKSRSKLEIAILLNQASLILKESKNDCSGPVIGRGSERILF
ncbi:uncharacterized protein AAES06_005559 [Glossophaga mutica]